MVLPAGAVVEALVVAVSPEVAEDLVAEVHQEAGKSLDK